MRIENTRSAYKIRVGKPEIKGPLRSSRYGWEDNTKMITKWEIRTSTGLILFGRDPMPHPLNAVNNLRILQHIKNFLTK
jgi:hypothetical protein